MSKTIGYIRVSSIDQNADRQLEGLALDKVFIEKASARTRERPQLQALLDYIREDDTLLVHSLDRFARNLDDLRHLVKDLTDRGITIHFLKENLVFSQDDNPLSKLLLSIMGAVAEFELSLIRERQREGIRLAREKKIYKGSKPKLTPSQVTHLMNRVDVGQPKSQIARDLNISRETLYRYLNNQKTYSPQPQNDPSQPQAYPTSTQPTQQHEA